MEKVRKPFVAGLFYSRSENILHAEIDNFLSSASVEEEIENIFGIVAPHAGYKYSGQTAADVYKYLENKNYETVIVISPSHREYFPGVSVYNGDAYKTPLGLIPVNTEMRDMLVNSGETLFAGLEGHGEEHALEVQLPFLQKVLKSFNIVPIVMGDQNRHYIYDLAESLAVVADEKTLIVASSDLSHFHSKEEADILDSRVENFIAEFNYEGLIDSLSKENCEACGGGPIAAMMKAAKQLSHTNSKIISRTDSGDITGDHSEVVGYLSALIY